MSGTKEFYLNFKKVTTSVYIILMTLPAYITTCYATEITWYASGNRGVVAAGPKESALAGIEILGKGGNAVDGAVATIFNLAVSQYGSLCIGGEVPFMFYSNSTGKVMVFKGMGGAPRDQRAIEWYYANGHPNSLQPGKRPRITLTPTIVLKNGKPVLAISVAGGEQTCY
jgi:gamma-glutamyltranspeptidase